MEKEAIVILGLKHSGKSTLGKGLAKCLGRIFVDTDYEIENHEGMSVRDLYNSKGAAAFMTAEEEACKRLIEKAKKEDLVISTGGGICDNSPALMNLKASGRFVFLKTDINISVERIVRKVGIDEKGHFTGVPAFIRSQNPQSIDDIKKMLSTKFKERAELYEKISDLTVELPNASIEENTGTLTKAVKAAFNL